MTDEDREQISKEERKKTVLTEGALEMALDMEAIDKQMGDIREDMIDLNEMHQELSAKHKILEGKRDQIRAKFWKAVRSEEKPWFRRMSEGGLKIMYKRVKEAIGETSVSTVQLIAFDATDDAFAAIKKIFRREERDEEE